MSTLFARIGDLAEQVRGVSYGKEEVSKSTQPGYLPVLRAGNITDYGLVFDDLVFVPAERISKKQKVRRYDVVVAASSGSLDVVGKAAPMLADFDGGFGAFCKVLRPNSKVHPGYFAHFFKTKDYRQRISALAAGANINNLRNEHLDEMQIPLPPLDEQKIIADILDRAEALRAKRIAALAQLDELVQSIFVDMFGDQVTNPNDWPVLGIEDICELIVDCVNRTAQTVEDVTPFKMIRTSNVKEGKINLSYVKYVTEETFHRWNRRATPQRGDVLLTREAPVGEAGIIDTDEKVFLGQRLMLYRADQNRITPEYLLFSYRGEFLKHQFEKNGSGSTVKHLPLPVCRSFEILVPPLALQKEFSRRVEAVNKLKTVHKTSLAELDEIFASLQYRAFRGEL